MMPEERAACDRLRARLHEHRAAHGRTDPVLEDAGVLLCAMGRLESFEREEAAGQLGVTRTE